MKEITSAELLEKVNNKEELHILDVRRDEELEEAKIPGVKHIILDDLPERLNELDKNTAYHIICRSGGRSGRACEYLEELGYDVTNIDGGMVDWKGKTE